MNISFSPPIATQLGFYLFVIAVLEGIAVYTWQFRKEPAALAQIQFQACKGVWLLALVFASRTSDIPSRVFWFGIYQMMAILSCFLWFRFITQLSGLDRKLPRALGYAMGAFLTFYGLVILTNPWHGLYWKPMAAEGATVWGIGGPTMLSARLTTYGMNLVNMAVTLHWALTSVGLRRRFAWIFVGTGVVGWGGYLLGQFPISRSIPNVPLGFLLTGLLAAWAFRRWCLHSILPRAHDTVIGTMVDGLLVVDMADQVVEINKTARGLFESLPAIERAAFRDISAAWPALAGLPTDGHVAHLEASRQMGNQLCTFQVTQTALWSPGDHLLGRILVFKDITLKKAQQARILEQQKAISVLAERDRLSRELHDGPGQIWSFISMQAQAVRTCLAQHKPEKAEQLLERLIQVTKEVHVDLRESITGLQAGLSEGRDLVQALEEHLQWYRHHCGLGAKLEIRGEWRPGLLQPTQEVQLLRILQEALSNVRKSAGASQVTILLQVRKEMLSLRVEDDGHGFDLDVARQKTGHYGLRIMRERAADIGAQLAVTSEPGRGTAISLDIPIDADSSHVMLAVIE